MKFKANSRRRALEYEKDWAQKWKAAGTFEKSVEQRPVDEAYVFYDGPPFITGVPHHGTLLSSIVKDAVPRYQTMKGKRVERVWGWDTHGLPAENFVEKQLGITDRRQIVTSDDQAAPLDKDGNPLATISLETYITKARESMVANAASWENVIDRVGRWVDFKGAYKTMDKDFMESVWWAFKQLHEAGKIYEGEKVLMYDTKFATPVSKNEVTMDNDAYQTVTDPSVYVKFRLDPAAGIKRLENFVISEPYHYLMYDVTDDIYSKDFPKETSGLKLKDGEFHLSLLKVSDEYNLDEDTRAKLEEVSKKAGFAIKTKPTLTGDFLRLVDEERERESIIALMKWDELELWRDEIRKIVPDADFVIPHTTLYTGSNGPIGYSDATKHLAQELDEDTVAVLRSAMKQQRRPKQLLAWTTTPWTLPANTALAVNPELEYVEVKVGDEQFILAKALVEKVLTDEKKQLLEYEVVRELKGEELVGLAYEPLIPVPEGMALTPVNRWQTGGGTAAMPGDNNYKVWAADYVTADNGTGVVHTAPTYGEDDFELAKANNFDMFNSLDDNGIYYEPLAAKLYEFMPWLDAATPLEVWSSNKDLAKGLHKAGLVWKVDYIRHEYPFNPRSGQRIMYRAIPSWFFDVQGSKPLMLEQNEHIEWFPAHLKHGRFQKNIEQAPDWNLSRDRFWATAMPVWKGDKGTVRVIGSYDELYELSGQRLDDYHRPWVDDITFEIDGEMFTRVDKVLDCWFESGSMPFAQLHYPFENQAKFEENYPADFIVEYIGQVRAWFYYVHVVNTSLAEIGAFGADSDRPEKNAFKHVITTGVVAGNDGRKMSKSLGNFTDPNELMDKFSADSLRFLLLSSPLLSGEDFALHDKDVGDVARKLSMIWNMYDFFTMYAEVDGWEFDPNKPFTLNPDDVANPLDKWVISRVHELNKHVTEHMDTYNIPVAMSEILPLIEDASNWYVRRSRRRFWKSEDDGDKAEAYRTLHYVLMKLAAILAPFTPFLAEELYQKLGGGAESVHLLDWPTNYTVDQAVLDEMHTVRDYVNQALSIRAKERLKIRQPLASVTVPTLGEVVNFEDILTEELNIKKVVQGDELSLDLEMTPELRREGLMREVIRHIQAARKSAGLNVDDRISLNLSTDDEELIAAIDEHRDAIYAETLTDERSDARLSFSTDVKVEQAMLTISLEKHPS